MNELTDLQLANLLIFWIKHGAPPMSSHFTRRAVKEEFEKRFPDMMEREKRAKKKR